MSLNEILNVLRCFWVEWDQKIFRQIVGIQSKNGQIIKQIEKQEVVSGTERIFNFFLIVVFFCMCVKL